METLSSETWPIRCQQDIVIVRRKVKELVIELGFRLIDQTKIITAASELARNTLEYGLGGDVEIESVRNDEQVRGIRLVFSDQGPGIPDPELALTDGYTSGKGLGLGLSGARRLMHEFHLDSQVGKGTRVTVTKWH